MSSKPTHDPDESLSSRFRNRILLVDDEAAILETTGAILRNAGFEVLTAREGFEALQVLRGPVPDLLIADLNMPKMSGFELLSVVRRRFPHMAVIATSSSYTPVSLPVGLLCDAFLQKGTYPEFELTEKVKELISESAVVGSRERSRLAPVWMPRSPAGYIILTCPDCLRSFSVSQTAAQAGDVATETCIFCGAEVRYVFDSIVAANQMPAETAESRIKKSRTAIEISQKAVAEGKRVAGEFRKNRRG